VASKVSSNIDQLIKAVQQSANTLPKAKLLIHKGGCDVQVGEGVTALRSGNGAQVAKLLSEGIQT